MADHVPGLPPLDAVALLDELLTLPPLIAGPLAAHLYATMPRAGAGPLTLHVSGPSFSGQRGPFASSARYNRSATLEERMADTAPDLDLIEVHNHRGITFSGRTAHEILRAAYAAPLADGLEASFEEWIQHQRTVARSLDGVDLPNPFGAGLDAKGAERAYVAILRHNVSHGALSIGPAPQPAEDPSPL